ncbi:MAG: aldehyde dehydrogenase family protein, partial [Acidimicrobiia bacterium]
MTTILEELKSAGKTGPLIGGAWSTGAGALEVIDPATEDVIAEVGLAEATHAGQAVASAAEAAADWAAT